MDYRSTYTPLYLALLIGGLVTFLLLAWAFDHTVEEAKIPFAARELTLQRELVSTLSQAGEDVYTLAALYNASNEVDGSEFGITASDLLSRNPFIQEVFYAPQVMPEDQDSFEEYWRINGEENYRIKSYVDSPWFHYETSPLHEVYPLLFAFNKKGIEKDIQGYDLASEKYFVATITQAISSGKIIPLLHASFDEGKKRLMLFKAIYNTRNVNETH